MEVFDDTQHHFDRNGWSDGMPLMPPTRRKVDAIASWAGRETSRSGSPPSASVSECFWLSREPCAGVVDQGLARHLAAVVRDEEEHNASHIFWIEGGVEG
jgi:hypothetical protein